MPKEKPHNSGQWTRARFAQFIKSALRGARWPPKFDAIKAAFVEHGINPNTGRKCKLHRCVACSNLVPQSSMKAEHINPVVCPHVGFVVWNTYIERLFVEVDGFQALCKECHDAKSAEERALRKRNRQ